MAELKVKKKKKFPVLWTILGIIAVVVIAWVIWEATDADMAVEQELAESEQIESERFYYAEPDEWEGAETDPWDDETTMQEDWSAEREVWGDESGAVTDEDIPEETETWSEEEDVEETTPADEDEATYGMDYSGSVGTEANAPDAEQQEEMVQNYLTFAEEIDAEDLNRRTTYRGIKKLTMAISALAITDTTDVNWSKDIQQLKMQTEQLRDERLSGQQASVIKNSFMEIANSLQNLQKKTDAEIQEEVSQVKETAQRINERDMISNQRDAIDTFFDEAADALEKIKDETATASAR